jgi:hypothetical protein
VKVDLAEVVANLMDLKENVALELLDKDMTAEQEQEQEQTLAAVVVEQAALVVMEIALMSQHQQDKVDQD